MRQKSKKIPYCDAIALASRISVNYDGDWAFLHSGLSDEMPNSRSFIGVFTKNRLDLDNLGQLRNFLDDDGRYFGWVSYEYKDDLEDFDSSDKAFISVPKIYFANFSLVFEFDHENEVLRVFFDDESYLEEVLGYDFCETPYPNVEIAEVFSNFSDEKYLKAINDIKEMIANGDFYQTNLTRKFFGEFNLSENSEFFALFKRLNEVSPANFSSFLRFDDNFVISASPELFLSAKNGEILSRPIKGTAPRCDEEEKDLENKNYLQKSDKEKAENLMIVDLVRNDLSRVCKAKSVKVENLFKVNSYKTLHHLSSEISAQLDENFDIIDAFDAAFPPGSMTGAPKISAIMAASNLENVNRGVYSGAIGYFRGFEEMNFSVVIRTLVCQKNKFEFQVGGAITYDSKPEKELEEIFVKAKGICKILNLKL